MIAASCSQSYFLKNVACYTTGFYVWYPLFCLKYCRAFSLILPHLTLTIQCGFTAHGINGKPKIVVFMAVVSLRSSQLGLVSLLTITVSSPVPAEKNSRGFCVNLWYVFPPEIHTSGVDLWWYGTEQAQIIRGALHSARKQHHCLLHS